jgi:RimJ/RimL family protein N-acetyltransferase
MHLERYEAGELLRDGTPIRIRAIRPTDKDAILEGFARLSERSVYQRFFQNKKEISETELRYLTELDFLDHVALAAVVDREDGEQLIGIGRFVRLGKTHGDRAEVAFVVGDPFQGRGVGTLLLKHLAAIAGHLGITSFEAHVLYSNRQMMEVFEHSGFTMTSRGTQGMVRVVLELGPAVRGDDLGPGAGPGMVEGE